MFTQKLHEIVHFYKQASLFVIVTTSSTLCLNLLFRDTEALDSQILHANVLVLKLQKNKRLLKNHSEVTV